jgi:hypothetical protein
MHFDLALPLPEAAHLGEIAAIFHIAPLPTANAAGVKKQPAAFIAAALFDSR